ncbi:cytochrome P450 [Streptomyces carminius]|uniref:Cytochrome P450 n=1 Tax=Streptomyces carminius TaxID=2665496 RepID=A0A2M8M6G0_9ACTN|nr:cytochrome P450 [Streptomyces carminius]PJE99778.1 cytochrome P450 [Streptomyces carminius]
MNAPASRVPLHAPEFAADPHRAYAEMRATHGPLVPVELAPGVPATLVIGYQAAVRILNDPENFPADPRAWQQDLPPDCPVKPMLEWRPNALRSSGDAHTRYRAANVASLEAIDLHVLRSTVARLAVAQINTFCASGEADVLTQYAWPLTFQTLNALLGCPPELGERVARGMAAIFEGVDAERGNDLLVQALTELVTLKGRQLAEGQPTDDVTTRLLAHEVGLNGTEMIHQLVTLYGAGIEPMTNLVTNTLRLMLSDPRFSGDVRSGTLSVRDALEEVLLQDPPMANYCVSYPPRPVRFEDVLLPAHQPVVISMAAANNDPAVTEPGRYAGNRAHLSWSTGPHTCPAQSPAYLIAYEAVELILDALPEMRLAVPADRLTWRPGPFHRALTGLPVVFSPSQPIPAPH